MEMNAAGGVMGGMQQPVQGTPQTEYIQQKPAQNAQTEPQAKQAQQAEIAQEEFDAVKAKVLEV